MVDSESESGGTKVVIETKVVDSEIKSGGTKVVEQKSGRAPPPAPPSYTDFFAFFIWFKSK